MQGQKQIEMIVVADEPALFFSSLSAAERWIEAVDVEEGIYPRAYDRNGVVYDVLPHGQGGLIVPRRDKQTDGDGLRSVLTRFLAATGIPFSTSDSVENLLELCERFRSA